MTRTRGLSRPDGRALFAGHLDLSRLHGDRGVVPCIFHRDKTASLSVDIDRGLFHCFGCLVEGGVRRFAQLVGELDVAPAAQARPWETELQQARRRAMEAERRRQMRMEPWWPLLHSMTWLRTMERLVAAVRAAAPDTEAGWTALEDAAVLERFVDAKTAEIEGIFARGRVA